MKRNRKSIPVAERVYRRTSIDDKTDCWNWLGGKNNLGYGLIRDGDRMRTTHRVSYEANKGSIPHNLVVCHSCDNPSCVNPDHLWLGTMADNMQDMISKGRQRISPKLHTQWRHKRMLCPHCARDMPANSYARCHALCR